MPGKGKPHKAYPAEFKAKCVRELLDGDGTLSQVASSNGLSPSVPSKWRSQVPGDMGPAFAAGARRGRQAGEEGARAGEVDDLNRVIGQLTVERDHLQREVRQRIGTWRG